MHLWCAVLVGMLLIAAGAHEASADASAPAIQSVLAIIQGPAPLDGFKRPQGVATDPARGIILIADTGNHRFASFDGGFRSLGVVDFASVDGRDPAEPRAVAVGDRMRVFLVDGMSRDIEVLTPRGAHLGFMPSLLPEDLSPDQARPQDIVVGKSGRFYVLFSGPRPGFVVAEPSGRVITRVGFDSEKTGHFVGPNALDVDDAESRIAISDPMAEKPVLIFTAAGEFVSAFGRHGEGDGTFSMVTDVTWGAGQTLWVTDTVRHSISVLDREGAFLGRIGGFGRGPAQFNYPSGCAFLTPDRLVVLERAGARFQVLEVRVPASDNPAGAILGQEGSGSTGASLATLQGR